MTSADTATNSRGLNESEDRPMEWERIRKRPEDYVGANLVDYEEYAKRFPGRRRGRCLTGFPAAASISPTRRSTAM